MKYPVAEKFGAPQGEGLHTGVPMKFIRLVGCSVGQTVCTACDTDFDKVYPALGGGLFTADELVEWVEPYRHACITGGEPMDRDLRPLLVALQDALVMCHIETSGTTFPPWLAPPRSHVHPAGRHMVGYAVGATSAVSWRDTSLWITVSPKPGWLPEMVALADELKVIVGGLGDGSGWPTVADAVAWSQERMLGIRERYVYIQPRNARLDVDMPALQEAISLVAANPTLRLSVQLHKFLRTR